jgi:LmbE family N-acetylglucosaminyl deacetylase
MSSGLRRAITKPLRGLLERWAPPDVLVGLRYLRAESGLAFPKRPITIVDSLPAERVLVLSPHPDDEVIGMGATITRYLESGARVCVAYLTDGAGIGDDRDGVALQRRAEAERVGRAWGIDQVFWEEPDTQLSSRPETVARMCGLLERLKPESIFLPSFFDGHFDHFATNLILADAFRSTETAEVTVHGYEVWDALPFPNWIVETTSQLARKVEVMRLYETPLRTTDFVRLFEQRGNLHHTLHVDSQIRTTGSGHAEAFVRLHADSWLRALSAYQKVLEDSGRPFADHFQSLRLAAASTSGV